MSREDVIRHIVARELHKQGLSAEVVRQEVPDLHAAACSHFGTWDTALRYAGISWQRALRTARGERKRGPRRKLDESEIVRELIQRHEAGLSLKYLEVYREHRALAKAIRYTFPSWRRALAAAGLGPVPPEGGKKWNQQKVIAAIQARHEAGKQCNCRSVLKDEPALVSAANRYFGNWSCTLQAAGISAGNNRRNNSG